jgi:antitoxin component YwqK of YwqJK toxin-antitoxin module
MNIFFRSLVFMAVLASVAFAEGDVQGLRQYAYWDNGKMKQCDMYDADGYLNVRAHYRYDDGTVEKAERFDRRGNKIEEAFYDSSGKLKGGIDGWAARRWWYYETNTIRSQISYDEYGRPVERKHYSESGKLVMRQFLDKEDMDPYEEALMHMLLGPANMKYYDPNPPKPDEQPLT